MSERVGRLQFFTRHSLPFTIREAIPDDAERLLAGVRTIVNERLEGLVSQPGEITLTPEQERAWIAGHADAENSLLLIAEHRGTLLGWLDLRGGRRLMERHAATFGISVVREWRGRGVGTALIQTMLDWAAANPILDKIKLGVMAHNEGARRLYRRLGFVEEGIQRREYKRPDGTYLDNVLMCRFVKEPPPARP